MNGWLIALGLLALYVVLLFWLVQTGRMAKWNLSLMLGFALMVRTQRGKKLIESIARPKRLWNLFADLGIVVTLLGMVLMTAVFIWSVWLVLQPDSGAVALGASEILVIPGVNPFVPLWYGLAALIITLVVHEGGHGVLARANAMRVKSLGLLIAVIPIGAFVEPDEDDLKAAPRRRRLRVFAAGPAVNLALAAVCLFGFAMLAGAVTAAPGVHVAATVQDAPSDDAGLRPGDRLLAANGAELADWAAFQAFMDTRKPGDVVAFTVVHKGDQVQRTAVLESRWDDLDEEQREAIFQEEPAAMADCEAVLGYPPASGGACAEALQQAPFLGVRPYLPELTSLLAHPFSQGGRAFLFVVSLPIGEVRGQPILSLYLPNFHDAPFEPALFWPLTLLLFWVFWINLMVGLTNILPMLPLDGGHIFRDAAAGVLERLRPGMDPQRRDRAVARTATSVSLVILGAFLLQIFGPWLMR